MGESYIRNLVIRQLSNTLCFEVIKLRRCKGVSGTSWKTSLEQEFLLVIPHMGIKKLSALFNRSYYFLSSVSPPTVYFLAE